MMYLWFLTFWPQQVPWSHIYISLIKSSEEVTTTCIVNKDDKLFSGPFYVGFSWSPVKPLDGFIGSFPNPFSSIVSVVLRLVENKTISIIFTCCIKVLYHGILYDLVVKSFTYIGFSSHPPLIFVMWSFKIFGVFKLVIFVKSLLKLFYDPIVIWGTI